MLKKLIGNIICSKIISQLIVLFTKNKIKTHSCEIITLNKKISAKTKAAIFWGLYEKAEIKMIKYYLDKNITVVELGCSIGVVTCVIRKLLEMENRIIAIESDRELLNIAEKNITNNFHMDSNVKFINAAVDYTNENEYTDFYVGKTNLHGNINEGSYSLKKKISVSRITLGKIIKSENINYFTLVSDIEGAEVGMIINEIQQLKFCRQIIIELHETYFRGKLYTVEMIAKKIVDSNFSKIKQNGNVFYFKNNLC